MAKLTFWGAAGCVTGSKYLVEAAGKKLLVDCGLFQGMEELKERNWKPLPVDPNTIDYLMLTHAHLDHTGWLPVLVRGRASMLAPALRPSEFAQLLDQMIEEMQLQDTSMEAVAGAR